MGTAGRERERVIPGEGHHNIGAKAVRYSSGAQSAWPKGAQSATARTRVPSQHREHRPKGVPSATARTRVPSQISAWLVMCLSCWGGVCGHGCIRCSADRASPWHRERVSGYEFLAPTCVTLVRSVRVSRLSVTVACVSRSIARCVVGGKGFIRSLSPRLELREARYYSVRPTKNRRDGRRRGACASVSSRVNERVQAPEPRALLCCVPELCTHRV